MASVAAVSPFVAVDMMVGGGKICTKNGNTMFRKFFNGIMYRKGANNANRCMGSKDPVHSLAPPYEKRTICGSAKKC
jgi:hypothetical protein